MVPAQRKSPAPGGRIGKYRIKKRLARGGFAEIFAAADTIEGVDVALKIPHPEQLTPEALEQFRREVRLTARLDHPNVLPIKNAEFVGSLFVVATLLGEGSLAERMHRRIPVRRALAWFRELCSAVAHAHEQKVIHCDLKPENVILFPDGHLRLADFGISRVAARTLSASGSGTVGYLAPEQALGRPSLRSDVFSLGLILWELLTGELVRWPFEWPLPGEERARRKVHQELVRFVRRALEVDQYKRFADAGEMLAAFDQLAARKRLLPAPRRRRRRSTRGTPDWRALKRRIFVREYRGALALEHSCASCAGPLAESMLACPWCGKARRRHHGETRLPARCPRCRRGRKLDWRFCAWCHGPGFKQVSERRYSDRRYAARCASCREPLLPHSRYCPWCRVRVRRAWPLQASSDGATRGRCSGCGWGVASEHWSCCPWCARKLPKK